MNSDNNHKDKIVRIFLLEYVCNNLEDRYLHIYM